MPRRPAKPAALDPDLLATDPVEFCRQVLKKPDGTPFVPHEGQEAILRGIRRITVASCGRQWGKSVVMGAYIAWYLATHANRKVYIIAPTLDQSRIIFNEVAHHFRTTLKPLVSGKIVEYPFPKIKLANGCELHARGANSPQYIRGKNAHVIVCDEASFFKDKTLTDVIMPMMTVTGKVPDAALILISTPWGEGAFKQLFEQAQVEVAEPTTASSGIGPASSWFNFPSTSNPHADQAFLDRVRKQYGEDSLLWRTEYLAEFVDDDLAVFPPAQLQWAWEHYPGFESESKSAPFPLAPRESHRYVQGADLANVNDYYVSALFDTTDSAQVVFASMTRFRRRGWTAIKAAIRDNRARYNHARTLIDATSLGESVVEELADIGAEGYKFNSNPAKMEVVQELARMFAEHRLVIPYDPDVIRELRYFQYEYSATGMLRAEAKRGHDDIVMAMALAAHLACIPRMLAGFAGVEAFDDLHNLARLQAAGQVGTAEGVVEAPLADIRRPKRDPDAPARLTYDPFRAAFDEDYAKAHNVPFDD